jgi:cardiolipin synthase
MPIAVAIGLFLYGVVAALLVIAENKDPKATLAWILLLWLLPVLGVLVYLFFGREFRAFSKDRSLFRRLIHAESQPHFKALLAQQAQFLNTNDALAPAYRHMVQLFNRNSYAFVTLRNQVDVLQNASQKYPRLLNDLQAAQHSIHMQYYIWESDDFTEQVKAILIERAKAGVQVRAIYDWAGSFGALSRSYIKALRAAGVRMEAYLSPGQLHDVGYRNHRKIVVIDGTVSYLGGMNLSAEHLSGGKHFAAWRDTAIRIHGDASAALQAIFAVGWFNSTQEKLEDVALFTPSSPAGEDVVPMQIVSSGPDSQWAAMRQLYFALITRAAKHIYIQSPFFIPDPSIVEALKAACLSGVDVRIMLMPRGGVYQVPYRAARTYCAEVARAGARIFFYQAGYFHPKTLVVDGEVCSVGTANLDVRSFSLNYETNAVIYDRVVAQQLEADFVRDMAQCEEFDWRQYQALPRLARLRDSIYRLCSPLL